jgi:UDPglucose--hexose-1-phosphate uridylyltransferase
MENGSRVVAENENFLTIAPYAPRFPFETWILPKRMSRPSRIPHRTCSTEFGQGAEDASEPRPIACWIIRRTTWWCTLLQRRIRTNDHYHWHIEFMPKLTKTAGFEWGTGFYINPTPPEEAAKFSARSERGRSGSSHGWVGSRLHRNQQNRKIGHG